MSRIHAKGTGRDLSSQRIDFAEDCPCFRSDGVSYHLAADQKRSTASFLSTERRTETSALNPAGGAAARRVSAACCGGEAAVRRGFQRRSSTRTLLLRYRAGSGFRCGRVLCESVSPSVVHS